MEQALGGSEICENTCDESQGGEGETNDGQILKMPAVGIIDGSRIIMEPFEGVGIRGKTEELRTGQK